VRLAGSIARGDQTGDSDADVLMVLENGEESPRLDQTRLFSAYFDLPIGIDLLLYTENEVAERLKSGDPFFRQLWQERLPLA